MRKWLPNQHGAWAFVLTPVITGGLLGGWTAWHWLLVVGWLSAYCFNFYTGLVVKGWRRADRLTRYRSQLLAYGAVAGLCAALLLAHAPVLIVAAVALLPIFAANLYFIANRNERAWLNDLLGVVAAIFMGGVSVWLGAGEVSSEHQLSLLFIGIYFAGTVWYVKTMIRERGKFGWLWFSRAWHVLACLLAASVAPLFEVVLVPALLRAWLLPGRALTAKQVGFIEVGLTLALVAVSLLRGAAA